ncbi:MAG: iron-containing alcohol dehydrogenase [Nannocystaceae bacterium]|nr:homogentisate 1,2-dioxygenase [bacterium]
MTRTFTKDGSERIVFGAGSEDAAADALRDLGAQRVLLIAQPNHRDGADRVAATLGDRAVGVFTEITTQVPLEVAEAARAMARDSGADWVLAHGGGTAIGVAKAVALTEDVSVAAIPTTYAGSERTDIWGLTEDGEKTTGRDARVRPKLVIYDPALSTKLPVDMSLQSLLNAMAHSVEALYAQDADEEIKDAAEQSLAPLLEAMRAIADDPQGLEGRDDALFGAYLAGTALGGASMALHHKLAHVLGGTFSTPHAGTHAVLLPHVLAFNAQGEALRRMQRALGHDDPARLIWDVAHALGVPTDLGSFGLKADDVPRAAAQVMQKRYANPRAYEQDDVEALLLDALHGRRPSSRAGRLDIGAPAPHDLQAATAGSPLSSARVAVVAVHGRGATSERFIDEVQRAIGRRRDVAIVAPQAATRSWYPNGFEAPAQDNQPHLDAALGALDAAWQAVTAHVPASRVLLVGFSQGACLALSWLASRGRRPGHTMIWSGANNPDVATFEDAGELAVTLSVSEDDPWVPLETFRATVAALEASGADVRARVRPGEAHHIDDHERAALRDALQTLMNDDDALTYQTGLGNTFATEAVPGTLPLDQNSPRKVPRGLHAEQINGTGFTVERAHNQRTWMYRLRPQIHGNAFEPYEHPRFTGRFEQGVSSPQVRRYRPIALPESPTDFLDGLTTFAGAGDPCAKRGMAIHLYAANRDMDRAMANIDGDLMIVPEHGRLRIDTEMGRLEVGPTELAIIPRAIRFRVALLDEAARGFVAEIFDAHFQLPERGPVGANGLADARHFEVPVAWFEDRDVQTSIVVKQGGDLFQTQAPYGPFDVVAWHGNYAPYKYDLTKFNSMGSTTWDHPDPSILTVLTSPADTHGRNVIDVAVFQRRWEVTEGTFRPPYFHRNSAIEFNAIVASDATKGPWQSGAFTFTPYLTPHGVSAQTVKHTLALTDAEADRHELLSEDSMWVQFESTFVLRVMPWMIDHDAADDEYLSSFTGYPVGDAAD